MNIYDFLYIVMFMYITGAFLYKVYNIMNIGKIYNIKIGFVIFMGALISWLVMFISFSVYPERVIYHILFRLANNLIILHAISLIIEMFYEVSANTQKQIMPYFSKR